ncbi:Histone acetyltransferase type B catalytic subunit [Pleurostoma richardsiae]|uniref:Histone acetyltransferase type B catalytic subunit n=1 Tax=Pleurostoma richardsiae TaxID=41990 RepID=A0AA38RL63_9PEZI|nr:Histone acetyltransferase type B catalytic subunit [Pleurostoma richardsiae]
MADTDDAWSSNSNEAVVLSLVTPATAGLNTITSFNPQFTYSIFGEDERIFGYKNLKISLRYHAADMRPNLKITYGKIFKATGDVEPTDIKEALSGLLPEVSFAKESEYSAAITGLSRDWTPPGTLLTTLKGKDAQYEIWHGSLSDPAIMQLLKRIQILVSFFIEGGTPIETEGEALDRWAVFFLYKKQAAADAGDRCPYIFTGYSTVYRFFPLQRLTPPASPSDQTSSTQPPAKEDFELPKEVPFTEFPCRTRISQFIILPPFQGKGNGARLYKAIFQHYLESPQTFEITVEDPNEAFDELRDLSDIEYLRSDPDFSNLRINTSVITKEKGPVPKDIVDGEALEKMRLKHKMAPRQFYRVVEMHLMSTLADAVRPEIDIESLSSSKASKKVATKQEEHEYKLWKLFVKQRLYRHNRDLLGQLEKEERIDKLEEALSGVELEYARLLAAADSRRKKASSPSITNGKRKLDDTGEKDQSSSKKARVEDA